MPAPAALAWYGAVGPTVALSELIIKFLDDFVSIQDDAKALRMKVKDDLDLIEKFMTFIKEQQREEASTFDNSILTDLKSYLQPLMIKCETEIRTIWAATEDKSMVKTYTSRLAIKTVQSIEKDLESWVQRLHVRVNLLSNQSKRTLSQAMSNRDATLQFQFEMQQISAEIYRLRTNNQTIDYSHLWLPQSQSLDFGGARHQRRMFGRLGQQNVLVEYVSYNAASSQKAAQDAIGELAFILSHSKPSIFHTLKCLHLISPPVTSAKSSTYGLVFEIPPTPSSRLSAFRSLSDVIADVSRIRANAAISGSRQDLPPDASVVRNFAAKQTLAHSLALSVHYLHSFGYVHQSIRTSNVLVVVSSSESLGHAYLSGFERARPSASASNQRRSDADWQNNTYRSPDRVATSDEETIARHTMAHDIYSLGVVLLELGIYKLLREMEPKFKDKSANTVRENLKQLATEELVTIMGEQYKNVVMFCLEATPESWLATRVAELSFVKEVLEPLQRLSQIERAVSGN